MFKPSKTYLLLYLIVALSFVYRFFLMMREGYPPGADIGLHNSIIHSITQTGNTNFLWNNFHMGGGVSLTFPGYHIFASYIILLTGLPDFLVHSLVASVFSSLIVLVAFLITKKILSMQAAIVVAVLVAFSRFDIEMLMWGGYPNVVALMLIPLTFYFFLQRPKFSLASYLTATSLLAGAIFLTHTLSAVVFVAVAFSAAILITIFDNRFKSRTVNIFTWLLPLALGAIIISPFLFQAVPAFLGANANTFTGAQSEARVAMLATQTISINFVLVLIPCVAAIFLLSRKIQGKFFSAPALLMAMWMFIPAIATQGYLVGLYTDFSRLTYFVYLPVIILLGLLIYFVSGFLAKTTDVNLSKANRLSHLRERFGKKFPRLKWLSIRNVFCVMFVLVFLSYSLVSLSIFAVPSQGVSIQSFYQVMNPPLFQATTWAKANTLVDSVFASDAYFGWWFSGFAQRKTLSASAPQFLIVSREFEPAKNVNDLLDTSYVLDNGIIQVREDGVYNTRHNPMFLAKLNESAIPFSFLLFNDADKTVLCRVGNDVESFDWGQLPLINMHVENTSDSATIFILRGNEFFNCTETTTVYQGVRFANMSITMESDRTDVKLDWAQFLLHTKYAKQYEGENTFALVDEQANVVGQLVFTKSLPQTRVITADNPSSVELSYNLRGQSSAQIQFEVGVYETQVNSDLPGYTQSLILNNTKSYANRVPDLPVEISDYQKILQDSNISYVICRDSGTIKRFMNDPLFSLVFANSQVSIFKVKTTI
jgi:hypothetical protein